MGSIGTGNDDSVCDYLVGGAGDDVYHVDTSNSAVRRVQTGDNFPTYGSINYDVFKFIDIVNDADGTGTIAFGDINLPATRTIGGGLWREVAFGSEHNADQINGLHPVWAKELSVNNGEWYWRLYAMPTGWINPVTGESQSGLLIFEEDGNDINFQWKAIAAIVDFSNGSLGINLPGYSGAPTPPTKIGTTGGDRYTGTGGGDVVYGLAGEDHLQGLAGNDTLFGHDDDDSLEGGDGDDILDGGAGADALDGGDGLDTASYDGQATVNLSDNSSNAGIALGDTLVSIENLSGSAWNDDLTGDSHDNVLNGQGGHDILNGAGGNDSIVGGSGDDTIIGGDGADVLNGGVGADQIFGGDGNDTVTFDDADLVVSGDDGYDTLIFDSSSPITFALGGTGFEVFKSGSGDDTIWGSDDGDVLWLGAGDDLGQGFDGDDIINGEAGDDILMGFQGNDVLTGGAGADQFYGDIGDDTVFFDDDDTVLSGGDGHDTLVYVGSSNITFALGSTDFEIFKSGSGDDTIWGWATDDELWLGAGSDLGQGFEGEDTINGEEGDDVLMGFEGNDRLIGGVGSDQLYGDVGDDVLEGSEGDDLLEGDAGNDTFVFAAGFGNDVIVDFEAGPGAGDVIELNDMFEDFNELISSAIEVNGDTVIMSADGGSITLQGVQLGSLNQDDFRLVA